MFLIDIGQGLIIQRLTTPLLDGRTLLIVIVSAFVALAAVALFFIFPQWISCGLGGLKKFFMGVKLGKGYSYKNLQNDINAAGYSYDPEQDIFYSNMDAWQRAYGFCRLYDETEAPLGIIVDCDPVYFSYADKDWMIEFWKGQYGMTTGCEVGVYTAEGPQLNIPGVFNATFYNSVGDEDLLQMSLILIKDGKALFHREERHWWLTGFKLGEFSEPSELSMKIVIHLKDKAMRNAFWIGLNNAGYPDRELTIGKNMIGLTFDVPHTKQPLARVPIIEWVQQRKNQELCALYQEVTGPYDTMQDKVKAIQKQSPEIIDEILSLGRHKGVYKHYDTVKDQSQQ